MFVTAQRWTCFAPSTKKECTAPSSRRLPLPVSCIWTCSNSFSYQLDEDDQEERIHFQQDGAPPHRLGEVREYLSTRFLGRWIGRAAQILWPARSPDLKPLDFFLCGFVKPPSPANVVERRTRITAAVAEVTPEMLRSVRNWLQVGRLPHYQWKSHWTITITITVLLHYDSSKHCTYPLNKFM
jgi:hypothetical protein